MLLRPYRVAVLSLATLMAPAAAAQEPPRSLHGIQIEPFAQMAALDAHVRYVGGAVIERHYLPFQVVLLYVGPGDPDAAALAGGAARCRIVVHWLVASLDQAQAAQWWNEQFERTAADPQVLVRVKDTLQRVVQAFGPVTRGDVLAIDYDPEQGLMITRNGGSTQRFAGLNLGRAVLALWLGPKVSPAQRAALLGAAATQQPKPTATNK